MKRLLTNKWFLTAVSLLIVLAVIILGSFPGSPLNNILKPVGNIVNPVQNAVKSTGNSISDFWVALTDGMAIRKQNEELRAEIAELQYQLNMREEAAIRYEELQEAFHIRETLSNYDIFGASVLSRESDEWFAVIRAGVGMSDGITLEQGQSLAVVDVRMNIIGRVIEVNEYDSNILPLLHEGFSISGKVNAVNGATFLIRGDASLKRDGLCLVTGISPDVIPSVGDEIVTSGDGGLFPQGIPIGVIESVDTSDELNITATLRPYSDIGDLNDIFILVPMEDMTEDSAISGDLNETQAAGS
ncbi:MAG: rod shape-determining protein MreC [Saccharofermentans sp.]|nr:rod shape-determining protein MreC [Saccharofermentans sp.]